ncbi:DNA-3-methyladenine glycosylase [soil metagenome]
MSPPSTIDNEQDLKSLAEHLAEQDADLATILANHGYPPLWRRPPGFGTLLHIILEQQVSVVSARAAFERLTEVATPLTPESFLELDDAVLKRVGFSRQKTRYGRALAAAVSAGELDLGGLEALDDDAVRRELTRIVGIGNWTADIYLMMALGRPDVWPRGDLALAVAVQEVKGLATRPRSEALSALAEAWQPYRAVAARLFWHYYLSR